MLESISPARKAEALEALGSHPIARIISFRLESLKIVAKGKVHVVLLGRGAASSLTNSCGSTAAHRPTSNGNEKWGVVAVLSVKVSCHPASSLLLVAGLAKVINAEPHGCSGLYSGEIWLASLCCCGGRPPQSIGLAGQ